MNMRLHSLVGHKPPNLHVQRADSAPLTQEQPLDRLIGEILRECRGLTEEEVQQILAHQVGHNLRFGEAAIALGLASHRDVLWALSQQFRWPYSMASDFSDELVATRDPFGSQAEAIRAIRSQLMLGAMAVGQPKRALAVLSPESGDGKTYLAANLAISCSQLGVSTLVVDADLRTPRQHQLFSIPNSAGLSGILAGRAQLSVIRPVPDLPNLFVLPVGTLPPNPLDLLQRPSFGELLQELQERFDHVIVDAPALAHGTDALVIAAACGLTVVIARRGRTRMRAVDALVGQVTRAGAGLAGVVINEH